MQLMTQWVRDGGGGSCLAFWDLGSQVSLVTTQYAQERKLEQIGRSSLKLSGLGSGPALKATYRYKVTLTRTDGQRVDLIAHGLETIALNLDAIDPRVLRQAFPEVPEGGLEGASDRVSLLIGQNNLRLFPVEARRSGGMALFKSEFGTGWIASGNAGGLDQRQEKLKRWAMAFSCWSPRRTSISRPQNSYPLRQWVWTYPGGALHAKAARNASSG